MAGPKAGEGNRLPSEKVFVLSNRFRDPHCIPLYSESRNDGSNG